MKFLFPFVFAAAVAFSAVLKHTSKSSTDDVEEFLEKEHLANQTRKKDISNLDYITIPYKTLPLFENPSEKIKECQDEILKYENKKIINLSGFTNTELKLQYGAANLSFLSACDENFSRVNVIFDRWAMALIEENYINEAITVLECAVDIGCDASNIYIQLANCYKKTTPNKIRELLLKIQASNSLSKNITIKKLKEIMKS